MNAARTLVYLSATALLTAASAGCSGGSATSAAAAPASASTNATPSSALPAGGAPGAQAAPAAVRLGAGGVDALIADYDRRCKNETQESFECEALRSLLAAEVSYGLLEAEKSGDQRMTTLAVSSLDLLDEPEILIGAMRVLGHFPEMPNLASKVVPLMLDSPYVQVQAMAANVLIANPDQGFQSLGRLWSDGHTELHSDSAYDEYPGFPDHYRSMNFPKYAGSEWFSAGDSDRSIGWSTKDNAAAVAKWYGDTLHAEVMNADTWFQMSTDQSILLIKPDQTKITRMQELMERLMRGDQTAQAELDKLKDEVDASSKLASEAMDRSVVKASMTDSTFSRDARWIIAAKKGERISRMVLIFPIPQIQRTVIKEIWDLTDYPSAWPKK